jgi:hypothetical protein
MKNVMIKNIFLILASCACLFSGCKNAVNNTSFAAGETGVTFSADKKFLLLPIEDRGEELQATIWVDDKKIDTYVIRIA